MSYRVLCVVWTVLWLAAAGALVYLATQPVPEEWLLGHADMLRPVHEYQIVEPAMTRWRKGAPPTMSLEGFWTHMAERPYVLLPDSAIREFAARISPDAVQASVRRIKTVLLAPCSAEMKSRVLADPFGLAGQARRLITPALTSSAPALYVCIERDTKEAALAAAESAARTLEELRTDGVIGEVQGVTAFIASPDRQTVRLADLTRMVNSYQLFATLERTLEREGVDRGVVRGFLDSMRALSAQGITPETITSQENRLRMLGMMPVVRYFFYRTPRGYMSVQRVLPAPGISLARTRSIIAGKLREAYITAIITGPEYFAGQYYHVVRIGLWLSGIIWGAGLAVMIAAGTLRQYILWLVLGRRAGTETQVFTCAPGYRGYVRACGLRHFDDWLEVERVAGARVEKIEHVPGDDYAPPQCRRLCGEMVILPVAAGMPGYWQKGGACRVLVYRARGRDAARLLHEYETYEHLRRRGVPVMPLVVFGYGTRQGTACAVLAYAWPEDYVPVIAWQARRLYSGARDARARRQAFADAVCKLMRELRRARCSGLAGGEVELMVRECENGRVHVRLSGAAGLRVEGVLARVVGVFWPVARIRRERDAVFVNRSLLREVFGYTARVRMWVRMCGLRRNVRGHAHALRRIQEYSWRAGYRQYAVQASGLVYNRAETVRLGASPADTYEGFMALVGERTVTRKRGRTVVTIRAGSETWYLKRHTGVSLLQAVLSLVRLQRPVSEAAAEWRGALAMEEIGLPCVPLVAMGEKMRWGFWERGSFIVTAELRGGQSLEKLLREGAPLTLAQRIELAQRLGRLARRLHLAGWAHCDFYLGHIYVVGDLRGTYRLHILDVQRVRRGARIGNRWSLKDITALYFSSVPLQAIGRSDRVRFLHAYLGSGAAERGQRRRFIRAVMRKAARVAAHTEKLLARRRARGELQ